MSERVVLVFALWLGLGTLAGVLSAGPRAAKALALLCMASVPILAQLLPADAVELRGLVALGSIVGWMRVVELVRDRPPRPLVLRVLQPFALQDLRRFTRVSPGLDWRLLAKGAAYAGPAVLGFWMVISLAPRVDGETARWLVRWTGAVIASATTLEVAESLIRGSERLLGFATTPLMNHPLLARSLGEFWGQRWNLEISRWLSYNCFRPLARRGHARLGLLAGFAFSGVLHAWPTYVALGVRPALAMFAFFFGQGLLTLAERPLRVARWPGPAARLWTVGLLVAMSPLFTEPGFRCLGL